MDLEARRGPELNIFHTTDPELSLSKSTALVRVKLQLNSQLYEHCED